MRLYVKERVKAKIGGQKWLHRYSEGAIVCDRCFEAFVWLRVEKDAPGDWWNDGVRDLCPVCAWEEPGPGGTPGLTAKCRADEAAVKAEGRPLKGVDSR